MTQPWKPEHAIDAQTALQLIREQFPALEARQIRFLGAGWDNTVFVIDESLIFRFPRREIAFPLLEAEWCFLPKLAPRLPLPIPIPQWLGSPSQAFPWPFIGYRMLSGSSACHANLSEEERRKLAEPIGRFLSALHGLPRELLSGCAIPGDNESRIDPKQLIPKITKNFEELIELGLWKGREQIERALEQAQHLQASMSSAIVHGDFYVRHLLVDKERHLTGIIDWGDIHFGNPAIDIAIAHSFLPVQAHEKFRKAYGTISDTTWELAKLRAIYSSIMLVIFGTHSHDETIAREGMRSLRILITG